MLTAGKPREAAVKLPQHLQVRNGSQLEPLGGRPSTERSVTEFRTVWPFSFFVNDKLAKLSSDNRNVPLVTT
jgi:hypothetical protein